MIYGKINNGACLFCRMTIFNRQSKLRRVFKRNYKRGNSMNRRELILGAAALAATATTSRAFAASHEHEHKHSSAAKHDKLIAAAADCTVKADLCLQHCIVLLGKGETDMAACARSASQAAAICTALQQLAVLALG